MKGSFTVVDWQLASNMISECTARLVSIIDFNSAKVFECPNGEIVVMPQSPFGKCVIADSMGIVDEFIKEGYFPTKEADMTLYKEFGEALISRLKEDSFSMGHIPLVYINSINNASEEQIEILDDMYADLKERKNFKSARLDFFLSILYLLKKYYITGDVEYGILTSKANLNPFRSVVLIKDRNIYFPVEYYSFKNKKFLGSDSILSALRFWQQINQNGKLEQIKII